MEVKPEVVKFVVKGAAGLAISALIGYTYKTGKKIDGVIDAFIDNRSTTPKN